MLRIQRSRSSVDPSEAKRFFHRVIIRDALLPGILFALSIENLSMMREINIVYPQGFKHLDFLNDIVRKYNEMQRK